VNTFVAVVCTLFRWTRWAAVMWRAAVGTKQAGFPARQTASQEAV